MADSTSRPTRWGGTKARFTEIAGQKLDTIITGHLTQEQIDAYQQYFRIEEISELLRKSSGPGKTILNQLPSAKIANFHQDPQPAPQYDQYGNRTNTREAVVLELLEKERHTLVELAVSAIHNYDPPADYKKPAKTSEKLYIPSKDYPDINFVGLLLGPRGNTLRQLQEDSGAKLAIRGKGSVKDGKLSDPLGRGPEDDLHVLITADTGAKITKAIKLTNEVIEKAISSPVGQNDLKRDQLRELAVLNGTLRETKPYVPPEIFNQRKPQGRDVTLIVCRICGNVGHYSRDCKLRNDRPDARQDPRGGVDSYSPGNGNSAAYTRPQEDLPPWKRHKTDLYTPPPLVPQTRYGGSSGSQPGFNGYGNGYGSQPGYGNGYGSQPYGSQYGGQYGTQPGQHGTQPTQNPSEYPGYNPSSDFSSAYGSTHAGHGGLAPPPSGVPPPRFNQQPPPPLGATPPLVRNTPPPPPSNTGQVPPPSLASSKPPPPPISAKPPPPKDAKPAPPADAKPPPPPPTNTKPAPPPSASKPPPPPPS